MRALLVFLAVAIAVLALACGSANGDGAFSSGESFTSSEDSDLRFARDSVVEFAAASATPAPSATMASLAPAFDEAGDPSRVSLQTAQRKVISSASVFIEVEVVADAVDSVRVIAESAGGFVEHLTSSGEEDRQRANINIRVPQGQFQATLERIEELGDVQSTSQGSEDVSEQFIDLQARLRSSLREEESLLSLLDRVRVVSEVLAIERELFRVRADIERYQGQLNFLERRIDLSTISISLVSPQVRTGEPPRASLSIRVSDVGQSVDSIKGLVVSLNGEVDRVFLSQQDGTEDAQLTIRVFSREFQQAMDFLEDQGKVRSKEISEATVPADEEATPPKDPDALITLFLASQEDSVNVGLIAAIAGPLGGIALATILGLLFYLTYGAGRRRA